MIKSFAPIGLLFVSAATVGVGCSSGTATPAMNGATTGTSASRLVGGASDTADPAVVVFETTGANGGDCTAEFISTTVLLTAAHCTLDDNAKPLVGAGFRIYMGSDIAQATDADWITIDPSNVHPNPAYDGNANDIAVLVLSKPAAVTPFAWNMQPLTQASVGKSVRLVGYGANVQGAAAGGNNSGFGVKRQLTTTVDDFTTGFVHIGKTGANGCDGDSGGPALLSVGGVETIIGLDSYSAQQVDCTGGDYYQRVDTQAAFIAQFMNAPASPDAGTGGADAGGSGAATSSGGGASASGDPGGGSSSASDQPHAASTNDSAPPAASGCAVARQGGARDLPAMASWLAIVALLAVARRRRSSGRAGPSSGRNAAFDA